MIIKDKIYINLDQETVYDDILPALTYDNPDYHQKLQLGLPVWGIPKEIKTYEYNKDRRTLTILRGEAMRVKQWIGMHKYEFDHPDRPVTLRYINSDFDLDQYQTAAVEAMKTKKQGIVHAVTSAGKSLIILKAIVEIGQKAVIVVNRKTLMVQLLEDIEKYIRDENNNKIKPGIIGNGHNSDGPITVAIDKTLANNIDEVKDRYGVTILDECHIAPANTIFTLLNGINSRFRYGFSGTLRRKDQKEFLIFSTFGQVIATIGKDVLLAEGRVVPVNLEIMESETQFDWDGVVQGFTDMEHKNPTQAARNLQDKTISLDPGRNRMILQRTAELYKKGEKVIVLSRLVDPCYALQKALQEQFGIESGVITGRDSKEALKSFEEMKHKDLKVIFATVGCVSTGLSISDLTYIVLISPIYTNELLLHQIRGRLMRTFKGKTHGTLCFVYDPYIFPPYKLSKFKKIIRE